MLLAGDVDRLLLEADAELGEDALTNLVAQGEDSGSGGVAAIHDGEGMLAGNSRGPEGESSGETGMLDEPAGQQLDGSRLGGEVRNGVGMADAGKIGFLGDAGGNVGELRLRYDWIFEERSRAAAVGVAFDEQHSLFSADVFHHLADVGQFGRGLAGVGFFQIVVGEMGSAVQAQAIADFGDNVAIARGAVEDAAAIGEVAGGAGEIRHAHGGTIERADGDNGGRDLLPIRSDVLHRRSADGAGNSGETFDAAVIAFDDHVDEVVPVLPGSGGEYGGGAVHVFADAAVGHVDDDAGKTFIGDEKIAAASEHEQFRALVAGKHDGLGEFGLVLRLHKPSRRSTDAKRGVGRQ